MKKYYLLTIPVVILIIGAYYFLNPLDNRSGSYENQQNQGSGQNNQKQTITPQMLTQNGSPLMGNPSAEITIVEWGDYQCTFCYKFSQSSKDVIIKEYIDTGKANFVFMDFPLNGPDSVLAAEASYCADDQGKYWEYHDEVYKNWAGEKTGWVNRQSLEQFAKTVNINTEQFNKCLDDKKYHQRVLDNENFGSSIGIRATPSFVIFNNEKITKIEGNQPISIFRQVLDTI